MNYLQIGNITVPSLWMAVAVSFIAVALFRRFQTGKRLGDWYWNTFFLYFIVWKFSYVLFEFPLFLETPLSALYFSGGTKGHFLAVTAVVIYLFRTAKKKDPTVKKEALDVLIFLLIGFETVYQLLERNAFGSVAQLFILSAGATAFLLWKRQPFQTEKAILLLLFTGQLFIKALSGTFFSVSTLTFGTLVVLFLYLFEEKKQTEETWNTKGFRLPFLAMVALTVVFLLLNPALQESFTKAERKTNSTQSEMAKVGYIAPDFVLTTLEGESIRLSDYKGKKIILNFWASWCPPCRSEMPHMEAFYKERDKQETEILAVNLTNRDDGIDKVKGFVSGFDLSFPVLLDKKGEVGRMYEVVSIPTSYFIDSNGMIVEKITGPMDQETMKKLIEKME